MGSADVVPGVSGGTVALVTGIYPRLVGAISTGSKALARFVRGDVRAGWALLKAVDWRFLIPLVLGAAAAILTLAHLIETWLHTQPIRTAAVFFGMIIATIVIAWRLLRHPSTVHVVLALGVGVIMFFVFGLQSAAVADPSPAVFFVSGALAICAFILPGVSGSFLLLSIGMYQAVLGAVNDRDLAVLAVFGLGAVLSLAVFSRLLEGLLMRHHDNVTAVLVGLMLGSVRILWPWPNGLGDEDGVGATVLGAPKGDVLIPILLAVAAAALVLAVSTVAERRAEQVTV
jgi:putative membrane protein